MGWGGGPGVEGSRAGRATVVIKTVDFKFNKSIDFSGLYLNLSLQVTLSIKCQGVVEDKEMWGLELWQPRIGGV